MLTAIILLQTQQVSSLAMFARFDGPVHKVDETYAVCEAPSGDIVFAGKVDSGLGSKFDFFTESIDPTGKLQWRMTYGPVKEGGDKLYGSLSQQFRRADIPDSIAVDPQGNIYVVGTSTFDTSAKAFKEHREAGVALVSYDSGGNLRYVRKIEHCLAISSKVAVSNKGVVFVAGVALDMKREQWQGNVQVNAYRASDGASVGQKDLGLDSTPKAMQARRDGAVSLVVSTEPWNDWTPFMYKKGAPPNHSAWRYFVLDSNLKVLTKSEIGGATERIRGSATIGPNGQILTIEGLPDGTDQLSCWGGGNIAWTVRLPAANGTYFNPADPKGTYHFLHDRVRSPMTSNADSVFVVGGPAVWNGRIFEVRAESFSLADGHRTGEFRHTVTSRSATFSVGCLSASETRLVCGGGTDNPRDAWVGYWALPTNSAQLLVGGRWNVLFAGNEATKHDDKQKINEIDGRSLTRHEQRSIDDDLPD